MVTDNRLCAEVIMIAIPCRKCGSPNIEKNGRTKAGVQKYHCRSCHFYGSLTTQDPQRTAPRELVERLHLERVSQHGIARLTGTSRTTIIWMLKKQ